MFGKLFGKSTQQPAVQPKQAAMSGKGKKVYLLADRLIAPIKLQGLNKSIVLNSNEEITTFVYSVMYAKSLGWMGGNDIAMVLNDGIVNKIIKSGSLLTKRESAGYIDLMISNSKGDARSEPIIGDILKLLEASDVTIFTNQ